MIDRPTLLADLKPLVSQLEDDLRARLAQHPLALAHLQADYDAARKANRTAQTLDAFTQEHLTQVAVAWVLATVFVRFVEDNDLCDEPYLSGPGKKLAQARDRYTNWLRQHPALSDREYLLHAFTELGKLPGLGPLLGAQNTLLHRIGPTADGARALREFWQQVTATGLRHDFTDPASGGAGADTRFLGDLYQDLSDAAKKRFALLQTPEFVEEFLLDRTLEPALAEFGLAETRLIDPACGSGHFLLGAFARLFARWTKQEPGTAAQERARRALAAVAGVDLNPFAVAIARFRLLVAALAASDVHRLADAYDFRPLVCNGDSLLHGRKPGRQRSLLAQEEAEFDHFYGSEDATMLRQIFGRSYHAVVGNPPYIVARDKALNDLYRARFPEVCYRQYSLAVPFTQVLFELARPSFDEKRAPGFVGMITANSFMKREFGAKLIEEYMNKRVEVTHVLDLSGAYIPGHGTPTVILLGRPRVSTASTIRAVLGIKGEPSTPDDPARGLVWSAIVSQVDKAGSQSEYVSSDDVPRERFAAHPWSIGGGGASDLKEAIEEHAERSLGDVADSIGFVCITKADEIFAQPSGTFLRHNVEPEVVRAFGIGEEVRDWSVEEAFEVAFPYDGDVRTLEPQQIPRLLRCFWPFRTELESRRVFGGQTYREAGKPWYEFGQIPVERFRTSLSIAFAFVATHNHFVLDRGGKVFNRSAPVIKLPAGASEGEHLGLLGLLNSSVVCFWLKQVCHCKGSQGINEGLKTEAWEHFYEFSATASSATPVPGGRPAERARVLDERSRALAELLQTCDLRLANAVEGCDAHQRSLAEAIALQEELDWECYHLYGLIKDVLTSPGTDVPGLQLGQRAFEIVLARQVAAGKVTTTWFERHGSTPITDMPGSWPKAYRDLVQRRIDCIANNADIRLIEQPEYKRRWNVEPWQDQVQRALRTFLLDRMEDPRFWPQPRLLSTARFAEQLRRDPDFVQVANLYRGRDDFDFDDLVRELVAAEAVPFLPVLRYKPSGLRKRADWEATWALQRRQDAGEDVGAIPVPPKYSSADFQKHYWSHRGKLDVPKERFILYPAEAFAARSDDPTPVFTWAGFDHAQQAQALAARYLERKEQDAAKSDQLVPLLAGLKDLLPWLLQWHNAPTADAPSGFGSAYVEFLASELRHLEKTDVDLSEWAPAVRLRGKKTRATKVSGGP